jgi:hypothetical protein
MPVWQSQRTLCNCFIGKPAASSGCVAVLGGALPLRLVPVAPDPTSRHPRLSTISITKPPPIRANPFPAARLGSRPSGLAAVVLRCLASARSAPTRPSRSSRCCSAMPGAPTRRHSNPRLPRPSAARGARALPNPPAPAPSASALAKPRHFVFVHAYRPCAAPEWARAAALTPPGGRAQR